MKAPMHILANNPADWWRNAVIYQVYPRSFYDANGDGIGDLAGITQKLPYIRSLGVDVVWISPFYPSPMKDFGYDIADYCGVDPMFGSLEDADLLLTKAHELGLRVMIDQVWSHTSNKHPWFLESRASRDNPKADWYIWADAKPDGSPPNNWMSIFGGTAWQWEARRGQYYLHNFLTEQPDLNWNNPQVIAALMDVGRFWLKRGVDGFRLDVVNFYQQHPELLDNRPRAKDIPWPQGVSPNNPFGMQMFDYNINQPEMVHHVAAIRALMDEFPGTITMGELVNGEDSAAIAATYVGDHGLHTAYTWGLLQPECFNVEDMTTIIRHVTATFGNEPHTWALGNHDFMRLVSRWGDGNRNDNIAKLGITLISFLKGLMCVYQGDELGLTEAEVPFEQMKDPYGIAFYPEFKGRDGCRTPMPWRKRKNHSGFTTGTPWLPVPREHYDQAVSQQERETHSVLHYVRWLLAWRKKQPALIDGDCAVLDNQPPGILAVRRFNKHQQITGYFNLKEDTAFVTVPGQVYHADAKQGLVPQKKENDDIYAIRGHGYIIEDNSYYCSI